MSYLRLNSDYQSSSSSSAHSSASLTSTEYNKAHSSHITPSFVSSYLPEKHQTTTVVYIKNPIPDTVDKLVTKANTAYNSALEAELQKIIDDLAILGGLHPFIKPEKINVASARETLGKLINISGTHYKDLRNQVLQLLPQLILRDPLDEASAEGVVSLAINLMKLLKRDLMQTEIVSSQIAIANIYGLLIEVVVRHYAKQNINAINDEIKQELKQIFADLRAINKQNIQPLNYVTEFAMEAIKRLTTDESATQEIMKRLQHAISGLGAAYNKEFGIFISEMLIAFKGLNTKIKKSWFKNLFVVRELASELLTSNNEFKLQNLRIIQKLIKDNLSSDWRFARGALKVLERIAVECTDPEIRKAAFFGASPEGCETDDQLPGIVKFVNYHLTRVDFDNEYIRLEAANVLMKFATNENSEFCYPSRSLLLAHFLNGESPHIKAVMAKIIPAEKSKQNEWVTAPKQPVLVFQKMTTISSSPSVKQVAIIPTKSFEISDADDFLPAQGRGRGMACSMSPAYVKEHMPMPSAPSFVQLLPAPPKTGFSKNVELLGNCLKGNFGSKELKEVTADSGVTISMDGKLEIARHGMKALIAFLKSSDATELDLLSCGRVEGLEDLFDELATTKIKSLSLKFGPSSDQLKALCNAIATAPNLTNVNLDANFINSNGEADKAQIAMLAKAAVDASDPEKGNKFILINMLRDPKQMNLLGMAIKRLNNVELAVDHYIAGIELHQDNPGVNALIYNYGISLFNAGNIDESIRCFEEVIALDLDAYKAWRELSGSYYKRFEFTHNSKDKERAYECIREAIKRGPKDPFNHYDLSIYLENDWKASSEGKILKEFIFELEETERLFKENPKFQEDEAEIWEYIQKRLPSSKRQLDNLLKKA